MTITLSIEKNEFLDEIIKLGGESILNCFQCGTCTGSCPSGRLAALRIRKEFRKAKLGLKKDVISGDDIWQCTTCQTCLERCPQGVETTEIIMAVRNIAVKEGFIAEAHRRAAGFLVKSGHLVPIDDKWKKERVALGLSEMPPMAQANKPAQDAVRKIMEETGFIKMLEKKG